MIKFYGGPLSQWAHTEFNVFGQQFTSAEQFMMFHKAMTFGAYAYAEAIMLTNDPAKQKAMGRKIYGFDADIWMSKCTWVVFVGNLAKFTQNPELQQFLGAKNEVIVEASPTDCIWGVGLAEDDPLIEDPENWRGANLLGQALMKVRACLCERKDLALCMK